MFVPLIISIDFVVIFSVLESLEYEYGNRPRSIL